MFGNSQNIFRSRWRALLWASGILLTAYCAVPSPEQTEQSKAEASAQQQHHNPWAIDPAKR
ncbi:MAG: hypothetical protein APF82_02410 [Sphingomonadales bacterium BRH_c42]|nr:MAG: hypothetical protein APF82_02410 [Sphingomonadales bacterium BRH_c42]